MSEQFDEKCPKCKREMSFGGEEAPVYSCAFCRIVVDHTGNPVEITKDGDIFVLRAGEKVRIGRNKYKLEGDVDTRLVIEPHKKQKTYLLKGHCHECDPKGEWPMRATLKVWARNGAMKCPACGAYALKMGTPTNTSND